MGQINLNLGAKPPKTPNTCIGYDGENTVTTKKDGESLSIQINMIDYEKVGDTQMTSNDLNIEFKVKLEVLVDSNNERTGFKATIVAAE